jgi:dTDP-4-amino-4,6-dideoxygalactose transaminase
MRGRLPDMHRVMELCKKYDMQLLEDSAHGYGCSFDGKKAGSFGVVSTLSSQANKLVNTGEGGMVLTDNPDLQAFFIFSAGSYEELWRKHGELTPPEDICLKYKYTVANKSVRMTNIQGALMLPQIKVMQERIDHHNAMYDYLIDRTASELKKACGEDAAQAVEFIPQAHKLVGPVYDSLQFRVKNADGSRAEKELPMINAFLKLLQERKHTIANFSDPANARFYKSWQYLEADSITSKALPLTTKALANVCDLRLLCDDTETEIDELAADIAECFKEASAIAV